MNGVTRYPTIVPLPKHSPIKNHNRHVATIIFKAASLTVTFLQPKVAAIPPYFASCPTACPTSMGVGGANSTLPYLTSVANLGLAQFWMMTPETIKAFFSTPIFRGFGRRVQFQKIYSKSNNFAPNPHYFKDGHPH